MTLKYLFNSPKYISSHTVRQKVAWNQKGARNQKQNKRTKEHTYKMKCAQFITATENYLELVLLYYWLLLLLGKHFVVVSFFLALSVMFCCRRRCRRHRHRRFPCNDDRIMGLIQKLCAHTATVLKKRLMPQLFRHDQNQILLETGTKKHQHFIQIELTEFGRQRRNEIKSKETPFVNMCLWETERRVCVCVCIIKRMWDFFLVENEQMNNSGTQFDLEAHLSTQTHIWGGKISTFTSRRWICAYHLRRGLEHWRHYWIVP